MPNGQILVYFSPCMLDANPGYDNAPTTPYRLHPHSS